MNLNIECAICKERHALKFSKRKRLKASKKFGFFAGYHYICRDCSNMYYKEYQGIGIKEYRKTVSRRIYADL